MVVFLKMRVFVSTDADNCDETALRLWNGEKRECRYIRKKGTREIEDKEEHGMKVFRDVEYS